MNICTSDIEANKWIKLVAIGFYDGNIYKVFNSVDKFLDYFLQKKYSHYRCYFHNGGRYDFLFLIEKLLNRGKMEFVNKSSGLLLLKFHNDFGYFEFADSYALLPASLERLIDTFNIEEKKISLDFTKDFRFTNKRMQKHLENDCISLYKIIESIKEREGFLSLTIAGNALKNFTNNFFDGKIWNVTEKFDKYFRYNYYHGGRVEVFKGYGKNLYYYDFNSLYSSVMLERMPVNGIERVNNYYKSKVGYYKVELKSETDFLISPLIAKNKTGNYYVNGQKKDIFYLMSPEIDFLNDYNIKYKVLDGYIFNQAEYLFNDYVEYYYSKKVEAKDSVTRYFAKLMLNSLYGKFGQQLQSEKIIVGNDGKDLKIFDSMNDLFLITTNRKLKFRGVYLASYITSLARMKHLRKMYEIGVDNIYYCDTDSIICDKKINVSEKIGDLKLEDTIKEGIFLMPKTYGYISKDNKEIVHFKGFSTKSFSYNNLKDLILEKKEKLIQKSIRVLGYKESIKRKNNILQKEGNNLVTVEQTKELKLNYTRRKLVKDKKHIFKTLTFFKKDLTLD